MKTMPIEKLLEMLTYNPETGDLTWKAPDGSNNFSRSLIGKMAGGYNKLGYRHVTISGTIFQAHRVMFAMYHGRWPTHWVDHVNGIPSDNRIET